MLKSDILKQKREGLRTEMKDLASKPDWSDEDRAAFAEKEKELDKLNKEIEDELKKEAVLRSVADVKGQDISHQDEKDINSFSLVKALREYSEGKLTGVEAEMLQEAKNENARMGQPLVGIGIPSVVLSNKKISTRSTLVAGSSPVVPTDNVGFIDALYARTLLVGMGAKTLSGLTGNVNLPYLKTKPTVKWAATENATADDAAAALDKLTLSPKRLTNFIPVSNQLLMQNSASIEQRLWDALVKQAAVKLDAGAINGSGQNGEPTGILGTTGIGDVAIGATGGAPTLAKMLEIIREVAVDDAEIGSLGFITNPLVRYKLQTLAIESGDARRIWDVLQQDMFLGYKAGITTLVPSDLTKSTSSNLSAMIFGNFNDLTIAQFGAIDLVLDNLTGAKTAITNLIMHMYADIAVERAVSFAACKDIATT